MSCLLIRDDKTIAYINKMHNYNPIRIDTPLPRKKHKNLEIITKLEDELDDLLELLNSYIKLPDQLKQEYNVRLNYILEELKKL